MKKLPLLLALLSILGSYPAFCQQGIPDPTNPGTPIEIKLPTILPVSPEVASLGSFGDIPVGHSTGVANVTIPIHTLIAGNLEIPISLSYNGDGFRVTKIASSVGLGWSLQAGGVVLSP